MAPAFSRSYVEQQALTRSPAVPAAISSPVLDKPAVADGTAVSGDGLAIGDLNGIVVSVWANASQTLSGGGALICWIYNYVEAAWMRAPDFDFSMAWTVGQLSTVRLARVFPALREVVRFGGRINFLTNAVTVSSGSDVRVRLDGFISSRTS